MKCDKQFLKGITFGVMSVSLVLGSSIFANNIEYILERSSSKIVLNGEAYESKNEILNYNGVTYVPLREVGQLLNAEMSYDNGTISITNTSTSNQNTDASEDVQLDTNTNEPTSDKKQDRTPEEVEQLIKDLGIDPDSDMANDLRENPSANVGGINLGKNKDKQE